MANITEHERLRVKIKILKEELKEKIEIIDRIGKIADLCTYEYTGNICDGCRCKRDNKRL